MGNYVSCNCSCACINASSQRASAASSESKRKLAKALMVVHSVEERVIEVGGGAPMKVAELMLEFPGHFVVEWETDISTQITPINTSSSTTIMGKRATPLPADHEASPGRIYILFPMHRLHTRVSPHEYTSLTGLLSCYVNRHLQLPNCPRKKSLHSLMLQTSSAKVTPLSSLQLEEIPPHLTASHQPADDSDAQIDDEIDQLLQQFCSSHNANTSIFNGFSKSGSLVRSKSWIPKLETICE